MTISNTDDVIDSRDVIARIEELETERERWVAEDTLSRPCARDQLSPRTEIVTLASADAWAEEFSDEAKELAALKALAEEGETYAPDWESGEALIRDDHFQRYAEEMVSDIGDLPKEIPHYIVIDWEATAKNIQQDYTSIDFDGVTYWVRS